LHEPDVEFGAHWPEVKFFAEKWVFLYASPRKKGQTSGKPAVIWLFTRALRIFAILLAVTVFTCSIKTCLYVK